MNINRSEAQRRRYKNSAEREKQRQGTLRRYKDPEERRKSSEAQLKKYENSEEREKLQEAQLKRYENPEELKKLSIAQTKRWKNLKEREKQSKTQKKRFSNSEERKKISTTLLRRYENPEERRKLGVKNIGSKRTIETRKKQSILIKKTWTPERRELQRQRMLGENNPMFGKKSPLRGKKFTTEERKACSERNRGNRNPNWNSDRELVVKNRAVSIVVWRYLHLPINSAVSNTTMMEKLGYTKEQFIKSIESKFYDNKIYGKMLWSNHGKTKGKWQIHHIKPINEFVKEGITDIKVINALDNLQPLWHEDHREAHKELRTDK